MDVLVLYLCFPHYSLYNPSHPTHKHTFAPIVTPVHALKWVRNTAPKKSFRHTYMTEKLNILMR